MSNDEWVLTSIPGTRPISLTDFTMRSCAVPTPAAGEMLVRLLWASVDPSHRASLRGDGYNLQNVTLNKPMQVTRDNVCDVQRLHDMLGTQSFDPYCTII